MVSGCGIVKVGKSNNVMHVELFTELRFGNAALLASVVVPLAGTSSLTLPGGTVIAAVVAATPHRVVCPAVPCVSAIGRTESESSSTLQCSRYDNMLVTLFAVVFDGWFFGWFRGYEFTPARFDVALLGANGYQFCSHLKWLAFKYLSAYFASMSVMVLLSFSPKLIRTFSAARCLSAMFQATRIS